MNAITTRIPYAPDIKRDFSIDEAGWKALVEAVYPSAKSASSVVMALSYCKARKLDPFKRPVHIVPMYDSQQGKYVETIWPGISELRTTAFRTGQFAGIDEAEFGPMMTKKFTGRVKVKGNWEEKTVEVAFPEWCRITVYRTLNGQRCKFVGPKVKWLESYASMGGSKIPNEMWQSRPEGQIEKVSEAAALRRAFPEEIGNDLTAEEMAGRHLQEDAVEPTQEPPAPPTPPTPPKPALPTHKSPEPVNEPEDAEYEVVQSGSEFDEYMLKLDSFLSKGATIDELKTLWTGRPRYTHRTEQEKQAIIDLRTAHQERVAKTETKAEEPFDLNAFVQSFDDLLATCSNADEITEHYEVEVGPREEQGLIPVDIREGKIADIVQKHLDRVEGL